MNTWTRLLLCGASAAGLIGASPTLAPALAQQTPPIETASGPFSDQPSPQTDDKSNTVVIYGRAIEQIGEANSASEGMVGYADLSTRPISRAAELAEVVPGMIATEHSSGGKANQYFLRGFNLDHGTDFAGFVEGVPINQRSPPHMSGYLDLNFLMADLVERVEFKKGLQYAENGDYSLAGSASFVLDDRLPAKLDKSTAYLKYSQPVSLFGDAQLRLGFIGYSNDWIASDQVTLRAVEDGAISRYGFIDPTNGGRSRRNIASAGLEWDNASAIACLQRSKLNLFHNFTYFIDPVLGDQVEQVERRSAAGIQAKMEQEFDLFGLKVESRIGADTHFDWLDEAGLYRATAGVRTSAIATDTVDVMSADVWGDITLHWTDRLRTTLGLRADCIDSSVDGLVAANAGSKSGTQWSPKLNIAYTLTDRLEVYASYAYSHSRFKHAAAGVDRVPNTEERVAAAGVSWSPGDGWEGSLRVGYLGPAPLLEDNSVRAPSTTLVNAGLSKDFGNFEIGLDILNLLDAKDFDMVYYYESQLQGEAAPVEDIHFHPVHPQTFVLNLKAKF